MYPKRLFIKNKGLLKKFLVCTVDSELVKSSSIHIVKHSKEFMVMALKNDGFINKIEHNRTLNTQLSYFLKNYKITKLVSNYKKLQFSENQKSLLNTTPSQKTNYDKTFKNSQFTYNKYKQFLLANIISLNDSSKYRLNIKSTAYGTKNTNQKFLQNIFKYSSTIESTEKSYRTEKLTTLQSNKLFNFKSIKYTSNKNARPVGLLINTSRTYRFLQTFLAKSIETPNISNIENHNLLLNNLNSDNKIIDINNQISTLKTLDIYNILFTKITNKSFVSYWLLPIAGLAFLTPSNIIYQTSINCFQDKTISYVTTQDLFNQQVYSQNVQSNKKFCFKEHNNTCSDFFKNLYSYIITKNCFLQKTNVQNPLFENKESFIRIKQRNFKNTEFLKDQPTFFSKAKIHPIFNHIKTNLLNKILLEQNLNLGSKGSDETFIINTGITQRFSSRLNLFNNSKVYGVPQSFMKTYILKNQQKLLINFKSDSERSQNQRFLTNRQLSFQSINPLNSTAMLQHNLNFITPINTLKLLTLKLKHLKNTSQNLIAYNYQKNLRRTDSVIVRFSDSQGPVISYQEALTRIDLNLQNFAKNSTNELQDKGYLLVSRELGNQVSLNVIKGFLESLKSSIFNKDSLFDNKGPLDSNGDYSLNKVAYKILFTQLNKSYETSNFSNTDSNVLRNSTLMNQKNLKQNYKNQIHEIQNSETVHSRLLNIRDTHSYGNFDFKQKVLRLENKNNLLVNTFFNKDKPTSYEPCSKIHVMPLALKLNIMITNSTPSFNIPSLASELKTKKDEFIENKRIRNELEQPCLKTSLCSTLQGSLLQCKKSSPYSELFHTQPFVKKVDHYNKTGANFYFNYLNKNFKKYLVLSTIFKNNSKKISPFANSKESNGPLLSNKDFKRDLSLDKDSGGDLLLNKERVFMKNLQLNSNRKQNLTSLSMIFKHQKMFKNEVFKNKQLANFNKNKFVYDNGINTQFISKTLANRLNVQKKRKAKKQRLETRRQKKRTRFFPRPSWLRYRMFLMFLNQRNFNYNKSTRWRKNLSIIRENNNVLIKKIKNYNSINKSYHRKINPRIQRNVIKPDLTNCFNTLPTTLSIGSLQRQRLLKLQFPFTNTKVLPYTIKIKKFYIKTIKNLKTKLQTGKSVELRLTKKQPYKTQQNYENQKKSVRDLKIKANYVIFKNQKTNNPPQTDKDKDKDTMFRDFWIWTYNNFVLNNFNQNIWWLLPNNKDTVSVKQFKKQHGIPLLSVDTTSNILPSKQAKNAFSLARIHWALNKTNNNSFTDYNTRYSLWGGQKLRNQSKNNKTKALEKQFITNWEAFFLNKKLNSISKKITSKLKQKEQKLNYLTTYSGTKIPNIRRKNIFMFSEKDNIGNIRKEQALVLSKNITLFNTAWWTNIKLKSLLQTVNPNLIVESKKSNSILTDISFANAKLSPTRSLSKDKSLSEYFDGESNTLFSSTALLHFCALISLVSISQVRCFLKFHLILLYKLSKIYNSLITQISGYFVSPLANAKGVSSIEMLNSKSHYFLDQNSSESSTIKNKSQDQTKFLTYFSLHLLKKDFSSLKTFTQQGFSTNSKVSNKFNDYFNKYYTNNKIYSKLNLISLKSGSLKKGNNVNSFAGKKSILKNEDKEKPVLKNASTVFTNSQIRSPYLKISLRWSPLIVKYKLNKMKMSVKKSTSIIVRSSKKYIFKTIFSIIDLFQTFVRSISNFFEKPAEFTTNWIAFGFLVEWSSDLITIIPENVDIYIWNTFSKISRVIPSSFMINNLTILGVTNTTNLLLPTTLTIKTLTSTNTFYTQQLNLVSRLPGLILITHLVHRRILYLFDMFIETLSAPDADLLRRQEKGMLFWDIWADFLVTAADYYNVNVAALSTIKAEQNNLIENISNLGKPINQLLDKDNKLFGITSGSLENVFSNDIYYKAIPERKSFERKLIKFTKLLRQKNLNLNITAPTQTQNYSSILNNLNRWSVNQYITYQSWHSHNGSNNSNGDLFIDYHPPKSFSHIPAIKYTSILQQPIGTLVCQIYAGLFNKQISKNILLVNPKNSTESKSNKKQIATDYNILLIQALAGETELKIITDNAQRYALVNRGFAIGIKLLRDVFDAIALNTPCIFLLLDIHAIGERRPMLISDYGGANSDDNGSFKEDFFGSQRDEVHEKNQVVYQLTRHAITHYRKPFKGDYSLAIPTNLYVNDLFLKSASETTSNLTLIENQNVLIKSKINYTNTKKQTAPSVSSNQTKQSSTYDPQKRKNSHLQLSKSQSTFAPPSTSPFTVLLLKEEKKLRPNKIVEELPWIGLPGEQLATKPRTSYSVRAKVSMLAELSLSNLSAKLDMITDLLVIIDSVRSNKGFVVFATTDVPHILDPALRRPGRLDETICMPNIINSAILNFNINYQIIKSVKPKPNSLSSSIKINQSMSAKTPKLKTFVQSKQFSNELTINLKDYITVLNFGYSIENSFLNYALVSHSKHLKRKSLQKSLQKSIKNNYFINLEKESSLKSNLNLKNTHLKERLVNKTKYKTTAYYEVGKVLLSYYLNNNASSNLTTPGVTYHNLKSINYLTLYSSKTKIVRQMMALFGGKISQLLSGQQRIKKINFIKPGVSNIKNTDTILNGFNFDVSQLFDPNSNFQIATSIMLAFIHKRFLYRKNLIVPKLLSFVDGNILEEPPSPPFSSLLIPAKRFENYKRVFHDSIFGNKMGQRKAQISFVDKINYHMQFNSMRALKSNNLLLSSQSLKTKLPYGDFKIESNNINYTKTSFLDHDNNNLNYQTFLKNLPSLKDSGASVPADKNLQIPTNMNWYYQNRILKRHGQYLTNQWWNGQLSEHNAETVFLSDIDWRSSFIKNKQIKIAKSKNLYTLSTIKTNVGGLDVLLDFPDADQYYNPRRRRWLLNKGYWSFWFNFDKIYSEEVILTWILESVIHTYKYLHTNLELLDFITTKFIELGYINIDNLSQHSTNMDFSAIKEILVTNHLKRF